MPVAETSSQHVPEIRAGQSGELTDVVSCNLRMLYKRAYRYLGNAPDAEDAVQHRAQFRGQAQISTWLTTIVTNAALMKLRRRRGVWLSLEQQLGENGLLVSDVIPDSGPDPEEICVSSDAHKKLLAVANRLSPKLRKTFQLRDIDGLTTKETSHLLGVPEGTVKARVARARVKLARILQVTPRQVTLANCFLPTPLDFK
jgi:RNA polymerase sigma-70 factor (ECF subfamily)